MPAFRVINYFNIFKVATFVDNMKIPVSVGTTNSHAWCYICVINSNGKVGTVQIAATTKNAVFTCICIHLKLLFIYFGYLNSSIRDNSLYTNARYVIYAEVFISISKYCCRAWLPISHVPLHHLHHCWLSTTSRYRSFK